MLGRIRARHLFAAPSNWATPFGGTVDLRARTGFWASWPTSERRGGGQERALRRSGRGTRIEGGGGHDDDPTPADHHRDTRTVPGRAHRLWAGPLEALRSQR